MRFSFVFWVALCALNLLLAVGCKAEKTDGDSQATPLAAAASNAESTKQAAPVVKLTAPLGKPKEPAFAALGRPKSTSASFDKPDRAAEVKRLIDGYQNMAVRYLDDLALATTPEEQEEVADRAPTVRSVRQFIVLLADLVASDPTDAPALDALVFLCKFVGTPEIDKALAEDGVDPMALLLEHHADSPKVIDAVRRLPRGDTTDNVLRSLFDNTYNPDVRWAAGAQLIASLRRNDREEEIKPIVVSMSEDRYLEGVPVGRDSNARVWAIAKLREIRLLGVGKVLPEVSGNKLEGGTGHISDYRGKVVVLDVWTTWCGPCVKMIPHQVEMVERLKDKPFAILSVSCDNDQETIDNFLEERSMPWDHWWVGMDSEFTKTLNIGAFPTIYVLDGNGVIRYKNLKEEELDEAVDALLAEVQQSEPGPQD